MHGKSRVSSAISVCDDKQNFITDFSTMCRSSVRVVVTWCCKLKVRDQVEINTKFFSSMIFILVLLGLMDFSDVVILCNRPNNCFDIMPLLSLGFFS